MLASVELLGLLVRVGFPDSGLSLCDVILDFSRHSRKGRLNILALLGGSLKEADTVMVGHLLTFFKGDSSSVLQIRLVSDQDPRDVVLGVLLNFTHPSVHGVERVTVRDVVDDDDSVGSLVVAGSDSLEALLAGRVPNLQLAHLLIDVDRADLEVDSDSRHEVLLELVIL